MDAVASLLLRSPAVERRAPKDVLTVAALTTIDLLSTRQATRGREFSNSLSAICGRVGALAYRTAGTQEVCRAAARGVGRCPCGEREG